MYRINEASCYKVVSVGELAGFDSSIHLFPCYSLHQRVVALVHIPQNFILQYLKMELIMCQDLLAIFILLFHLETEEITIPHSA